MTGFKTHTGIAAPLLWDNIDTDQIIPSREMKTVSKEGLGGGLFAGQRYAKAGGRTLNPDFILNQKPYTKATILISGLNFGCGSSREHAVWSLKDYGIRVIIAESFGEIFYNNCIRNGIVPVQLSTENTKVLAGLNPLAIDLPKQTITSGKVLCKFDMNAPDKAMLISGLDPIDMSLEHAPDIDSFLICDAAQRPWVYSG